MHLSVSAKERICLVQEITSSIGSLIEYIIVRENIKLAILYTTMLQPLGVHNLCRDIHKLRNLYSIQSPIVKFLNHEITTKVLTSPRIESLLLYSE